MSKVRLILAGLVALLALSSILPAASLAGGGPFWRQRKAAAEGNGVKISEQSPVKFQAKSGRSILSGTVGTTATKIECAEDRAGGILYNNSLQGQGKIIVSFFGCTTELPKCKVVEPIVFKANLHLVWKWQGLAKELEGQKQTEAGQVPDLLFYTGEIAQGTTTLEEKEFVKIELKKNTEGSCLEEGVPLEAKGYESATLTPEGVEHWTTKTSIGFTPGPHEQHFWNGTTQVSLITSLMFDSKPATFTSQDETGPFLTQKNEQQEVSVFES